MNINQVLYKYTTSETGNALNGLFHKGGHVISCNKHTMIIVRQDYPKEKEGLIIDKSGNVIQGVYPDYQMFISIIASMETGSDRLLCDLISKAVANIRHSDDLYLTVAGFTIKASILNDAVNVFKTLNEPFFVYSDKDKSKTYVPVVLMSKNCTMFIMPSVFVDTANIISISDAINFGGLL